MAPVIATGSQAEILERGQRLRRRLDKLTSDIAFLEETILTRPWKDVSAHRQLLDEWREEQKMINNDLAFLRKQWLEYEQDKKKKL